MKNRVLVSVCMITYNHSEFIVQAIEGVLMQITDFDVELIISNDASADNTDELIYNILKDYCGSIVVDYIKHSNNIGMHLNGEFAIKRCRGEYIAICEGDDYWTDPNKLQLSVDFLEENSEYGLVHHDADHIFQNSKRVIYGYHKSHRIKVPIGYVYDKLLVQNFIQTPTVVFRNNLLKHYYDLDESIRNGHLMVDYVMWLTFSRHTKFFYIKTSMSVYRVLENSASHSTNLQKRMSFLDSYCNVKKYFLNGFCSDYVQVTDVDDYFHKEAALTCFRYGEVKMASNYSSRMNLLSVQNLVIFMLIYVSKNSNFIYKLLLKVIK